MCEHDEIPGVAYSNYVRPGAQHLLHAEAAARSNMSLCVNICGGICVLCVCILSGWNGGKVCVCVRRLFGQYPLISI